MSILNDWVSLLWSVYGVRSLDARGWMLSTLEPVPR